MSGPWDPQASGRRVGRPFLGQLRFGLNPLGVSRRRVGPTFLGRLVFGPFPFKALGSGMLAKGAGTGPKAQGSHNAPLFLPGRKAIPGWKKK